MTYNQEIIYINKHLSKKDSRINEDVKNFKTYEKGAITPFMAYKKFLNNNDMNEDCVSLSTFERWVKGLGYIR